MTQNQLPPTDLEVPMAIPHQQSSVSPLDNGGFHRRRLPFWVAIFCVCLVNFDFSAASEIQSPENAAKLQEIRLPKDQTDPILVFDESSSIAKGKQPQPQFQLFADGNVKAKNGQKAIQFRLDPKELQALLRFVIAKNQVYEFKTEDVKALMNGQNKPRIRIADAPTSTLKLNLPRGKHQLSVNALFLAVRFYPESKAIQNLQEVKVELGRMVALRFLGDRQKEIVDFVNRELQKQGIKLDPVSSKEIRSANETRDGGIQVSFLRQKPVADQRQNPTINISYFQKSPKETPRVRVYGLQKE